jgi:hypothetical protein
MKKVFPIITTQVRANHNPGDTFIGIGGQYIFENLFGPINWLVINKFSQEEAWLKREELIKEAGIVYYAGMPQYNNYDDWCFWYDKELWEEIIVPWDLKVISLAGGAGFPNAEMTPEEFTERCLESEKTVGMLQARKNNLLLTTVRDNHANKLLNSVGIENHVVACSALFASRQANIQKEEKEYVVLVPPNYKSIPDIYRIDGSKEETMIADWLSIFNALKKEYKKVIIVCHWHDEFLSLRNHVEPNEIFFTTDYLSLLNIYKKASLVISARLHAALPAFGIEGTKAISIAIDTRGHAAGIVEKIPVITYAQLSADVIIEKCKTVEMSEKEDIDKVLKEYHTVLMGCKELHSLFY